MDSGGKNGNGTRREYTYSYGTSGNKDRYEGIKRKTDDGNLKNHKEATYLPPPSGLTLRWVLLFREISFGRSVRES